MKPYTSRRAALAQSDEERKAWSTAVHVSLANRRALLETGGEEGNYPIFIRLLGGFQVVKMGYPVSVRGGGKTEALLCALALRNNQPVPRDMLLDRLWPEGDGQLAGQSLHSLVYFLHKLLSDAICGSPVVVYADGGYRLNREVGVGTDIDRFEELIRAGEQQAARRNLADAAALYRQAVDLYQGDLYEQEDMYAVLKREHLRARYLTLLVQLANYHYDEGDCASCLEYALRLLANDPCREDGHRLVMRCYVKRGERAQALRQYRLCESILRAEFDAVPEPATIALFNQVRDDPDGI